MVKMKNTDQIHKKFGNKAELNEKNFFLPQDNKVINIQSVKFSEMLMVPYRFKIMFLLYNYDRMNFTKMQKLLSITSGNLQYHLKKLQDANWVKEQIALSPRLLKFYSITPLGEEHFEIQIQDFKKIINSINI